MAVAQSRGMALSAKDAWNAVALDERLDLLARCHAHGIMAGFAGFVLLGAIAWGFDEIYILAGGFVAAFFLVPMFMSYSWRRGQPALVLAYLAARTVSRRYAYAANVSELDIILIYRGELTEIYKDREQEEMNRQKQEVDFDSPVDKSKQVWVCLLRGAIVIMSERAGGAKLDFLAPVTDELVVRKPRSNESGSDNAVVIEGVGISRGRMVLLESTSRGAQYVFERQTNRLIAEYKPPPNPYAMPFHD